MGSLTFTFKFRGILLLVLVSFSEVPSPWQYLPVVSPTESLQSSMKMVMQAHILMPVNMQAGMK